MTRLFSRLFHRLIGNVPDPAAVMQTPVIKFSTYCERTQVKAIQKAKQQHKQKFRVTPAKSKARVVPIETHRKQG